MRSEECPACEELARDAVGAVLGAGEHQHAPALFTQEREEGVGLRRLIDHPEALLGARGDAGRIDRDAHRVTQPGLHDVAPAGIVGARHGGREEQGLTVRGDHREDAAELRREAHVEHAVGLVEHEDAHVAHAGGVALDVVDEASGRGDDPLGRRAEAVHLLAHRRAAEDRRDARGAARERAHGVGDLLRELARGGEDEGRGVGVRGEALQRGEHERGGLAGAGLRAAEEVTPREGHGDGGDLDGRRGDEARSQRVFNGAGGETEGIE